ncbi:Uncharacterised protein [Buttiauxella agrestis]|uniref:Lipoprotein n=1 Tax=Buttiauxella agrestis TaxID=82977 RepID=A0A381C6E7_9ENTR|nr:hypothetical protein [Buttiauxella agrestis]SUW62493.1 Uncharacterised protein [Buttiauxella agrestis]
MKIISLTHALQRPGASNTFFKLLCLLLLSLTLFACTGLNYLYPKFTSYTGSDSAIVYVKDDGFNYSIYIFVLTEDNCFEKKERRLLTRNMMMKGSGTDIYEYKVQAGKYYVIGYQEPRAFHYRTFIPDLNSRYKISSGDISKLPFDGGEKEPEQVKGWNIKNICKDMFGYRHVD